MLTYGTAITMITSRQDAVRLPTQLYEVVDDVVLTPISPSSLYIEPGAANEDEANYYFIKDAATVQYLKAIPQFTDAIERNASKISSYLRSTDSGTQYLNSDYENNVDTLQSDFITYIGRVKTTTGTR